jgi:multidrug resistance protein, MATE family
MESPVLDEGTWWSRPCGVRDVVTLALPLVISTISWTVMNFVDRMFLAWHSLTAMAASMPAGMLFFSLVCFPMGLLSFVNTFVAQYHGAGRPERIGVAVGQALRLAIYMVPLFLLAIPVAPYLFYLAGHEPLLAGLETIYFQILMFGAGALVISTAQSTFFTGRGETRAVMVVDVTAAVVNIVLDYFWIFGIAGFPAMGIEGAAWATVASQWLRVGHYWLLIETPRNRFAYGLVRGRSYDPILLRRILRFGIPSGFQFAVEVAGITLFIMLIGRLGSDAMVATTLAFNVNSVAFVPIFGLGIAVATMVGQQLGQDRPDLAARATWTSYWIAMVYTGAMAVLYWGTPDLFLVGHAAGMAEGDFQRLREITVVLLRFVAMYALFDATALIFMSAIKGAGDTRFIMILTAMTAPLPIVFSLLGVHGFGGGLLWCWTVFTAWLCMMGTIYLLRFLQGRWRKMRVIEPELVQEDVPGVDRTDAADHQPADCPAICG